MYSSQTAVIALSRSAFRSPIDVPTHLPFTLSFSLKYTSPILPFVQFVLCASCQLGPTSRGATEACLCLGTLSVVLILYLCMVTPPLSLSGLSLRTVQGCLTNCHNENIMPYFIMCSSMYIRLTLLHDGCDLRIITSLQGFVSFEPKYV